VIGFLRGDVVDLEATGEHAAQLIVDVHGVGYLVTVSARHAAQLRTVKTGASLAIHTHVREGAIQLYGFPDALPPAELFQALGSGDLALLTAVPGVGKRTAQRLQLELGQNLNLDTLNLSISELDESPRALHEVHEALETLGYGPDEIRRATKELDETLSTELLLREALNALAPTR
jgi:Holliday junction DNA helicase RuvA